LYQSVYYKHDEMFPEYSINLKL